MDEPLIYTTKGNVPVASLQYATQWDRTDDYIKFVERYTLDGEVVKESAHVLALKPLDITAIQGG